MPKPPACPETGKPMARGTWPMEISYKGQSATVDMPGWYCDESGQSLFAADDLKVSDEALKEMRLQGENL